MILHGFAWRSLKNMALRLKDLKSDFAKLKNLTNQKKFEIPKKYSEFKKLLNSDNFNRFKCIFLPIDAVIKALKL